MNLKLLKYVNDTHSKYITGDFSHFLYGFVKMIKPSSVVELGTGYGTTSFLTAQALKENNLGIITTIDDGKFWEETNPPQKDYNNFINTKIKEFNIEPRINFINKSLNFNTYEPLQYIKNVDILFNDIDCNPEYIIYTLSWLLPRINHTCYFFIDGSATYWPAYSMLEMVIKSLNEKNIPKKLLTHFNDDDLLYKCLRNKVFTLTHFRKNETSKQNSFSLIKIEDKDIEIR